MSKLLTKEEFIQELISLENGEKRGFYYNEMKNPIEANYVNEMFIIYNDEIAPSFLYGNGGGVEAVCCEVVENKSSIEKEKLLNILYDKIIEDYASEIYSRNYTEEEIEEWLKKRKEGRKCQNGY